MSKTGNVKATIADFIAKKVQKEKDKDKTIDIKVTSMDNKTFTVKKPSDENILNFLEGLGDSKSPTVAVTESMKFIYRNCPDLQNEELHEALGIKDPYDIINILFDFKDKQEIMEQFNNFIGFKTDKVEKEIKNSSAPTEKQI